MILLALFDGAATWDSHIEMVRVERRLASRKLTAEQRTTIGRLTAQTPKLPIVALVNGDVDGDEADEQYAFVSEIQQTFAGLGWTVRIEKVQFPRRPRLPNGLAIWGSGDTLRGVGGAFEAIRIFPTMGSPEVQELVGAPTSPKPTEIEPMIRIDVFNRPTPF